jgi:hypothetical protein
VVRELAYGHWADAGVSITATTVLRKNSIGQETLLLRQALPSSDGWEWPGAVKTEESQSPEVATVCSFRLEVTRGRDVVEFHPRQAKKQSIKYLAFLSSVGTE